MIDAMINRFNAKSFSILWEAEDWWTVWLGFIIMILSAIGLLSAPVVPDKWGGDISILNSISADSITGIIFTGFISLLVFSLSVFFTNRKAIKKFIIGFPLLFALSILAMIIGNYIPGRHFGFDNVIWALVIGLFVSNIFKTPSVIKEAVRTELYIKTGLVLMGASIIFNKIIVLGALGLGVAWLVTPIVLASMYVFSQKVLKMQDERNLAITLSAATSVCGVSAAIAAGTAVKATKEQISLAISLSLMFTIIMMVAMPAAIKAIGMDYVVGGALIGGTIDSTGAVVASGAMLNQDAMEVASVIKMIQNVLIGLVAFTLALIWVAIYEKEGSTSNRVSVKEIWIRMPKFVIGFFAASIVFSFILTNEAIESSLPIINSYRNIFFTFAFISIGLDSNFRDMAKIVKSGKPVILYIAGQSLNILLTLIAAWVFFSGRFFSLPF